VLAAQLLCPGGDYAMIENTIADPSADKDVRKEAFDMAFKYLEDLAKSMGYSRIVGLANRAEVNQNCERLGYYIGEDNLTLYVKDL
jgi:hypothetical protein